MIKKINQLKKKHGVTNRQIARERGVSETWVSLVLHGKGESRPLKEFIARRLECHYGEIWPARSSKKAA